MRHFQPPISTRSILALALTAALVPAAALQAQTQPKAARPQQPRPAKPAPSRPATPPVQKPPDPAPAAKAVPHDLRLKTVYTAGDQRTESVSYVKGMRERFEFADMIVLQQHDLHRTVQISRAGNVYLVVPDDQAQAPAPDAAATAPAKAGTIAVTTTITDTGERKTAFGLQARHVKTVVDKQPMPG